jgi:hypothetical protein
MNKPDPKRGDRSDESHRARSWQDSPSGTPWPGVVRTSRFLTHGIQFCDSWTVATTAGSQPENPPTYRRPARKFYDGDTVVTSNSLTRMWRLANSASIIPHVAVWPHIDSGVAA